MKKIVKREKRNQLRLDTARESRRDSRALTTPQHFGHGTAQHVITRVTCN